MLTELTAIELTQLLQKGEVTAYEIAESFIERTLMLDPLIHAWTAIDERYILHQAKQLDTYVKQQKSLALLGIPIGIKDIFNTEYYPTQKGSPLWKNYKAGNDARCVSYLRRAGACIFGKTDTAELAVHANAHSLNPYDLSRVTGSSSGGSAAAVATAMVPVALGSQTGGSITRPASWCGVYAMKPSFGLIPRTGVLKTTDTLDTIGFFGRSIADMQVLLNVLRIHGDNFPIQEQKLKKYAAAKKKWKVAFCHHHLEHQTKPEVYQHLAQFKKLLLSVENIEVLEIELPPSTKNCHALHRRIYHPCLAYYLKMEFTRAPEQISESLKSIFEDAALIPPSDYKLALAEQTHLANELEDFFAQHEIDILLMNSSNGSAPLKAEPLFHHDLNPLWTMAWLPVINVPQFKCEQGFPFGLQVIGPRFSDYQMLSFLTELQTHGIVPKKSEIAPFNPQMLEKRHKYAVN